MIIFGTYFGGKHKMLDGQGFESKFLLLMVPLIPTSTFFVIKSEWNKRNGFEVPVNGTSVGLGYLRFFSLILGIAAMGYHMITKDDYDGGKVPELMGLPAYVVGLLLFLLWGYAYFVMGKPKPHEITERKRLGNVLGVNALPEWLPLELCIEFSKKLKTELDTTCVDPNWMMTQQYHQLPQQDLLRMYAYYRYQLAINHDAAAVSNFERINSALNQRGL
jgi:hypothetical protein